MGRKSCSAERAEIFLMASSWDRENLPKSQSKNTIEIIYIWYMMECFVTRLRLVPW